MSIAPSGNAINENLYKEKSESPHNLGKEEERIFAGFPSPERNYFPMQSFIWTNLIQTFPKYSLLVKNRHYNQVDRVTPGFPLLFPYSYAMVASSSTSSPRWQRKFIEAAVRVQGSVAMLSRRKGGNN